MTQALRRCRNVPDAAALIRLALAYALTDLSRKDVAAWAGSLHLAELTGPGLCYRLRERFLYPHALPKAIRLGTRPKRLLGFLLVRSPPALVPEIIFSFSFFSLAPAMGQRYKLHPTVAVCRRRSLLDRAWPHKR